MAGLTVIRSSLCATSVFNIKVSEIGSHRANEAFCNVSWDLF
jgi:hypothetical protein